MRSFDNLAIFTGRPTFQEKLHVGRPNIGDRQRLLTRINDILDRRWLSNGGPYVLEFEQQVADLVRVKNCIAICNGTTALEIAIRALGLAGEVIVPSFTFVATAHALKWQEITPVFCDIDSRTHTLDPVRVEELITPKTTGIIGVHLWGRPCQTTALERIARTHNLKLLFDAAHAFGCSHQGRMIGGFGDLEVFSFQATKFVNTIEGGAIVTNNDQLAKEMRLMRNFGFSGYDNVVHLGINGKMNEFSAAMGLTGLESIAEVLAANYSNYKQYELEFRDCPGVRFLGYNESEANNYQYIVLELDESVAGSTRAQLLKVLWAENIMARRYFYPGCHRMEPYRSDLPDAGRSLPETEKVARRVVVLPTGQVIGPAEISKICQVIRTAVTFGPEIKELLLARALEHAEMQPV